MLGTILSNNMSDSAGKISPIFVVSEMEVNIEFVKEDATFGSVSTKNESIHHHASFYTVSQKNQDTKLLAITSLTIIRFSKFFHQPTR